MRNMLQDLFIITGASAGLGTSISKQLAKKKNHLVLIARNRENLLELQSSCILDGATVDIHTIDLSTDNSYKRVDQLFAKLNWNKYSKTVLFNNASTILPISHLDETKYYQIKNLFHLNLLSSTVLSQLFMRYCKKFQSKNTFVVNISSGVSLNPVEGWGLYCISKSGLNMLTSVIANDSKRWKYPIKSVSINPGPLNTEMQKNIRNSSIEQSPIKTKFVEMHEKGELLSPKIIANRIIKLLRVEPFPNGEYLDLNAIESE